MKFKSLIKSLILGCCVVCASSSIAGAKTIQRVKHFNTNFTNLVGSTVTEESFHSWHYSAGYWKFEYNNDSMGGLQSIRVNDADVKTYFPGNSKVATDDISVTYGVPSQVQSFINIYGVENLGLSFNVGQNGSINNDIISYEFINNNSQIRITFRPVFLYDTNSWWEGTNAWNSMSTKGKVPVPKVKDGYGTNFLSVFNDGRSMEVTQLARDTAWKDTSPDQWMYFSGNGDTVIWEGYNRYVKILAQCAANSTVWSGGSHGVYWYFPVNVYYYDLGINVNPLTVTSNPYTADGVYWVKSGSEFNLKYSSTTTDTDDIVRVNANFLKVNSDGSEGYINTYIKSDQDSSTVMSNDTVLTHKATLSTRSGDTLNAVSVVSLDGDKDVTISSFGRLVNFPNAGATDFGNEQIYKNSSFSNSVVVKSDSAAPKATSADASYDLTDDVVDLNLYSVSDSRSGVNSNSIYAMVYPNDNSASPQKVSLNSSGNNYSNSVSTTGWDSFGDYTADFYASDNVGNEAIVASVSFSRSNPNPVNSSVVIKDYEYEDSTTKWVKADDEFLLYQNGYLVGNKPTGSHVILNTVKGTSSSDKWLDSVMKSSASAVNSVSGKGFSLLRNNTSVAKTSGTKNVLEGSHYYKASSSLHGKKFYLSGTTFYTSAGSTYNSWEVWDPKMLGIDAQAPIVSVEQTGRSEMTVTSNDADSGLKKIVYVTPNGNKEYTLSGNSSTTVIPIVDNSNKLLVYDNVGNYREVDTSAIKNTTVTTTITSTPETVSGRKKLKVTVTATVKNPIPKKTLTVRIRGNGDGIPFVFSDAIKELYIADSTPVTYSFYVDDTFNTTDGPPTNYDVGTYKASIGPLEDVNKSYYFYTEHLYESFETSWIKSSEHSTNFMSGFSYYKYNLIRIKDASGNATNTSLETGTKLTSKTSSVEFKYLPTGKYRLETTMYDFNNNPSGKTTVEFDHVQPNASLDLNVTAVKDVSWKNAVYPFNYKTDAAKFPLGSAYLFKDNPIKLGYTLNFNVAIPSGISVKSYEVTYDIYGKDGSNKIPLNLTVDGKTLAQLDSTEGTTYLKQTEDFTFSNNKLYLKHYLPASMIATTSSGANYTGKIYVDATVTGYLSSNKLESVSGTYNLYAVDSNSTAFDDLELDKQR